MEDLWGGGLEEDMVLLSLSWCKLGSAYGTIVDWLVGGYRTVGSRANVR